MSSKVAIITAAGQGVGAAIARELAASGYQVSLLSSSGGALELAKELNGIGMTGSVTAPADLEKLVDATLEKFGRIDAVVNNTGHPPKGELLEIPDEAWHLGLDMLILNVVRMARLVTPIFMKQGGGAIVNISTFSAFEPKLSFPVSSTLRSGLASFIKLYADRYAEHGIRINNVLPGYMDNYPISEENLAIIPMKRYGKVQEIAKTVRFLLSDDAGYITGQNIRADGGITHSIEHKNGGDDMNATQSFDVILAGGGVMGCATAYYLLQADPSMKVAIVEMDPDYTRNSTVLSDGNIRQQFNIRENILISLYGIEKLKTFREDMAVGDWRPEVSFEQQGNLFLADAANRADAKAGLAQQQRMGCEVVWLEPAEVKARFPLYDETKFAGGTFGRLDGTMDPQAVLTAFQRKSVALGATYIQGEVAEVMHSAGRVSGVRLADGTVLNSKYVVNSAGAWGTKLARTAGVELPVEPVRRQVFVLQTTAAPGEKYPLTVFPSGLYLIHANGSQFMCGKSFDDDPVGFDFTWNHERFNERMWPELVEYVPAFDQLKLLRGWSGLYDVNRFDGNVLLGEWPGLQGFLLVNGFSGHGFQQCHAIGRYLSEIIRGVAVSLDLSIFSPARLLENKPVYEGHGKLV